MKRRAINTGICILLLLVSGFSTSPALAGSLQALQGQSPEIQILQSGDDGFQLLFELPEITMDPVTLNGLNFQEIAIPGGGLSGVEGEPALPTYTRLIAIPNQSGVSITFNAEEEELLAGYRVMPLQGANETDLLYSPESYLRDDFGDMPLAEIGDPAILRDFRVIPLTFRPVRYNPARDELLITRRLHVNVQFAGVDLRNSREPNMRHITPSFNQLYKSVILNYEEPDPATIMPGTYLIICPNIAGVISRLQPLVDWRTRKGSPVILTTTAETGTSASSIKNYIQTVYNTADPPLEFVCLAGDATTPYQVNTFTEYLSGYYGEGDHPYTQLEGGDVLADVHIGRITCSSLDHYELIVGKTVGYESTPYMDETDWFTRGCVVGDQYNQTGISAVYVNQWVKTGLLKLGYTEVDTIWTESFVAKMQQKLNRGDTVFSYRGWWGMSSWSNSYAYALTNGWKMPFCVNITCDTGSFASGTAFSEGFLRSGSVSPTLVPGGGVGSIGTATTGTHTRYNNCMHYGIFQGLLYEQQFEMGAALTRGKMEMFLNYNKDEPTKVEIWSHWNNLMGDPAGEVWTAVPRILTVTHPSSIYRGTNSFALTVKDGPFTVAHAQVCLLKEGETYVVGYTDSNGQVELPITAETTGDLLVTVTQHNKHPYLATVPVTDPVLLVSYQSSTIDDDNTGTSSGNNDGLINPGETIELTVQVRNYGYINATGVTAALSSDDPYVTITDGTETFGDISGGASAWSADDFDIEIGLGSPNDRTLRFDLDVTDGGNYWHSILELKITAAELAMESYNLHNVGGDEILDPGETGELSVKLKNTGAAIASNVTGTLVSLSPVIEVLDAAGSFGTINIGATGDNAADHFGISASSHVYPGYLANLAITTEFSGGVRDTSYVGVTIGTRAAGDPIGPDLYGYWAFDNTDTAYDKAPAYNWIEIDPGYGGYGQQVTLGDYGDSQDKSTTVDIPFAFQYYGRSFSRATICSNGWMSMGSTYLVNYRNWTIPGAGSPNSMLAVFWDDLQEVSGGKVFQLYDSQNHRWIVQWSRMRNNVGAATETFQAILYDPGYYPTDTGDGIIVFQYHTISNIDSGGNYATVGIENETHTDGLLYTFWNSYPQGAASLASGRAIRFEPVNLQGSDVADLEADRLSFALYQNQPNPASATTTIRFTLDRPGPVDLAIYDVQGRILRHLVNEPLNTGMQSIVWDGLDRSGHPVPSGIYFYRLKAGERNATRQLIFLK
ncbi:MAG: T9SS type A sorting domain-containing protein [Candidatus Eisenbacteria bacterium]|uniref:T9SS type A sorting domain-containing protein n=1 Tax=Eiseniibacteriota bacterium TaxID=2212470 RepID=A0A948RZ81_UNCEI|nr:T9SS type A sorting domain-containing protein [Candidatus Eisenbacteria bacterium]MBU1949896.1 T9SS type A sorting domain-containing protein [Candidatus Eisenbacteria bacterium]MBU2692353.1 T9SS type A sorting domain-containing protein [Candidatus Eisenbacteria bacterium]